MLPGYIDINSQFTLREYHFLQNIEKLINKTDDIQYALPSILRYLISDH